MHVQSPNKRFDVDVTCSLPDGKCEIAPNGCDFVAPAMDRPQVSESGSLYASVR